MVKWSELKELLESAYDTAPPDDKASIKQIIDDTTIDVNKEGALADTGNAKMAIILCTKEGDKQDWECHGKTIIFFPGKQAEAEAAQAAPAAAPAGVPAEGAGADPEAGKPATVLSPPPSNAPTVATVATVATASPPPSPRVGGRRKKNGSKKSKGKGKRKGRSRKNSKKK